LDKIRFSCRRCRVRIKAPIEAVGGKGKCPSCQNINIIPHPDEELIREVAQLLNKDGEEDSENLLNG